MREPSSHVAQEIRSQPECWERAAALGTGNRALPEAGERVAVVGCGTSWFMAQSYAVLRESAGLGETDAFAASELPAARPYDRVLALTRSGTTTEVLDLLANLAGRVPTTVVTGDPAAPAMTAADQAVLLDFADEKSVVQTRFATSALALLRASLGEDLTSATTDARRALTEDLPPSAVEREQFTFLGTGWSVGLANEAALKLREASLSWTEAYPAMEYRHGPISITDGRSVVWFLGAPPAGLPEQVSATGALVIASTLDPMAELVRIQRLGVALAARKGLDPDQPRNLTRSVILSAADD